MIGKVGLLRTDLRVAFWAAVALSCILAGCGRSDGPARRPQPRTLTIGFGLGTSATNPQTGMQQAISNIALESLVALAPDGRPRPRLLDGWSVSQDGLTVRLRLRPLVTFHDGTPARAEALRMALLKGLPQNLGPPFDDVKEIRAVSDYEIEISLKRPSAVLLEGLDLPIEKPGSHIVGTGPFSRVEREGDLVDLVANRDYYLGKPFVDRIVMKPYDSVRAAWADLLRGQVDVLYEIGIDALDSLQPSTAVKVFTFQRSYAYIVLLNIQKPYLRDAGFRRALNAAVDRDALVRDVLDGHGRPATGAVSPRHWAYDPDAPAFRYEPQAIADRSGRPRFRCLITDAPPFERLGLVVQRQLQAVGVDLALETVPLDVAMARLQVGDFDLVLVDAISGPGLVRPYSFWHSGGPLNLSHFSSKAVDAALDSIRHAADEAAYKAGVSAFQRAIVDDPPAIFLAWSERARAVSRRFDVPAEPEEDVLKSLRLWRPTAGERTADRN